MAGWIKLHRTLKDWEWYDDNHCLRLLIHLLVSVNYEDKKWRGEVIKAGSMVYSWSTLSDACGMSIQQCRTAMSKLENSGEVTRQVTAKYQAVSLTKWEKLQNDEDKVTANPTAEQQQNNSRITTTKEIKNNKNKRNTNSVGSSASVTTPNTTEKFLTWFNKQKEKHTGKPGKFKVLSKTDLNNLKQLKESYTPEEFADAFEQMAKSKWVQENNNMNPAHFLRVDNFNRYLDRSTPETKEDILTQLKRERGYIK